MTFLWKSITYWKEPVKLKWMGKIVPGSVIVTPFFSRTFYILVTNISTYLIEYNMHDRI